MRAAAVGNGALAFDFRIEQQGAFLWSSRERMDAMNVSKHAGKRSGPKKGTSGKQLHSASSTPVRPDLERRRLITMGSGAALLAMVAPGVRHAAWAAGSDAPEKPEVKVGFIPLTDCASVVMASVKGFDRKHGITITPSKEASWASVRDKLVNGELDASHVLYGLVYGVQMGIGGPKKDMAILMNLNHNGQAFTLSRKLFDKGVTDGPSLKKLINKEKGEYTFAQTFPTGTHAMWLYYWLGAHGRHSFH